MAIQTFGNTLELYADRTRCLPVVDPDDRELVISCGCALYFLSSAARKFSCRAVIEELMRLIILTLSLFTCNYTSAAPLYYTVEGIVTKLNDPINDASLIGMHAGSFIRHTFLVDFDQEAYVILNDRCLEYEYDIHIDGGSVTADFDILYVDYISGTPMMDIPDTPEYLEFNKGQILKYTDSVSGNITPGINILSASNLIELSTTSSLVPDWSIGEELILYNRWGTQY